MGVYYLLLYTLVGSVLLLLVIIGYIWQQGNTLWDVKGNRAREVVRGSGIYRCGSGCGSKGANMWWAHVEAPLGGSVILAVVLLKVGAVGVGQ